MSSSSSSHSSSTSSSLNQRDSFVVNMNNMNNMNNNNGNKAPPPLSPMQDLKKQQPPNSNSNSNLNRGRFFLNQHHRNIWGMLICAVFGYAVCQLDAINTAGNNNGFGFGFGLGLGLSSTNDMNNNPGSNRKQPIRQISVLGERNSGTRWTWSHLSNCFNHSVQVKTKLTRYKHWFQYPGYYRYPHDTLVVAQFRNPYDWLKAMQHVPHHAPAHLPFRSDHKWKQFLDAPWTMKDGKRIGTDRWNNLTEPCQEHFEYKDIISCAVEPVPKSNYEKSHYSEHQPFYELNNNGSGIPYDNIMELRSDKIRNFLSIRDYEGIADVWIVQYEYLLTKGTQELIDQVAEWTGITPKCTPMPPQQRRNRAVEKEMANYIRDHLNWTTESWIGYGPHS